MYLFFDTETTGLPKNFAAPASDTANWPRMVQLAWRLMLDEDTLIKEQEYLIQPDGWDIPPRATEVHGITQAQAMALGVPLRRALETFTKDVEEAKRLVAHNIRFDAKIVGAELYRCGMVNVIAQRPHTCTMQMKGRKWAKLGAVYEELFDKPLEGAHDALVDTRACAEVFFELKRRGYIRV